MSHKADVLKRFKKHGNSASFHYADDTCAEWDKADNERIYALEIFDSYPTLQTEMRELAKEFLWSLDQYRATA